VKLKRLGLTVVLTFSILASPLAADAQPAQIPRVGWLGLPGQAGNADTVAGFREGLRELGYTDGKNVTIEYRFAEGRTERLAHLAAELVRLPVNAIVVTSGPATIAAKRATATIPIVIVGVADPVGIGAITSLAQPGGNVTGVSSANEDISAKWLELLREVVPKASQIGYLDDLDSPTAQIFLKHLQASGRTLGVSLRVFSVTKPDAVAPQLTAILRARVQGIVVGSGPMPRTRQREIVEFAAQHRLPAMYGNGGDYVDAGGLMSYGPSRSGMGRQGAVYVGKILKGAKPADLPVEQPTKVELVINMRTAKALGLTIPSFLLLRADRVIE
jgi:putative tryptophan/tyrosine transport system substrate-binding protein